MLSVLSIEIAAVVLVTGVLNRALEAVDTGDLTQSFVLAFGALFTVPVVLAFVYGRAAINRRALLLLDQWTPMPERPADHSGAAAMKTAIEQRNTLKSELGLDQSLREELGTTLVVGLPLLSALVADLVGTEVI